MQDYIFAAYPFCRFSDQVKFNCRRYFKPCFSGYHTGCHVGTSNTGGECSQCSVCTGMRICTNDHISCHSQSFFRKQCVFDSHLSYVKIIGDLIFTGKFTYTFAVFCWFDIFIRDKMIHYQCNLILVKYFLLFKLVHLMNGNRGSNIISQDQIQICLDQLTGFYTW